MAWERAGNLPERLLDLRHALGMTQAQFGDVAGVSDQTVSDWENDRSRPARATLTRLAKQLGIPVVVFQAGGEMPSTLLKRLAGARTAGGPTPGAARSPGRRLEDRANHKLALAQRLAFLRDQLRAYHQLGESPSPTVIEEWLRLTADVMDVTRPPGVPARPETPPAGPPPEP